LKFAVYENGRPAQSFASAAAYLFGADSVPIQGGGAIRFKDGVIECKRRGNDAAGLALVWPVKDYGRLLLTTTRLQDRSEPYVLSVELARAALMQILLKREDWAIFEETDDLAAATVEAQGTFIEAISSISNPAAASVLADDALAKAVVLAETLASRNAEVLFSSRCQSRSLGRHCLGCRIDPQMLADESYGTWLLDVFGYVTIPLKWSHLEPQCGQFDFAMMDRCIEHLSSRRLAICAGPLLRFSRDHVPAWLLNDKRGFEKVREAAYGLVSRIVSRYSRHVHAWQVISGMNAENCFGFNFEQVIEMTRTACLAARAAEPNSRKLVEILQPWGEYHALDRNTVPPLVYADTVIQSGVPFDAFGLLMHFGRNEPGAHLRDLMQIAARLDSFCLLAKPIHITGVAVPDSDGHPQQSGDAAGVWRRPWDQDLQSEWIEQFYRLALARTSVQSVTYSCLADADDADIIGSGLLNRRLEPKKAFLTLARLQKLIQKK